MFKIRNLKFSDINRLVLMARAEGWVCDGREFEMHRRLKSAVALVVQDEDSLIGSVTAFAHARAAWVGNLLVQPAWRGRGIGTALLSKALKWVDDRGMKSTLLASAPAAQELYEQMGFKAVENIYRWRRPADYWSNKVCRQIGDRYNLRQIVDLDGLCWDDDRTRLLRLVRYQRVCLATKRQDGFIMVGRIGGDLVIGPGAVAGPAADGIDELIEKAVKRINSSQPAVLDAFSANKSLSGILMEKGFSVASSTTLMCRGATPAIKFDQIIATASLGSMG